jgi:hypothetical protein
MMKTQALLALVLLVGACERDSAQPTAPAPAKLAARAEPPPPSIPVASIPRVRSSPADEPEPRVPLDPAGVLDEAERSLLEAHDATLTKEQRVARAHAQRKLVMADPEHPLRATLLQMEADVASGAARTRAQERWSGRAAFPDRDDEAPSPP